MNQEKIKLFTFYDSNLLKKIRIGPNNDGGYILNTNEPFTNYDLILSGGAGRNTIFEVQLSTKFNTKCYIFDHSVNKLPHLNHFITFFKQKIDISNTFLLECINNHNDIFLKLDIEGAEYNFIDKLSVADLNKFKQIIIEFHKTYTDFKLNQLAKIRETHIPIHIHANNCTSSVLLDGVLIPKCLEITFLRKTDINKVLNTFYLNNKPLPTVIDKKNCYNKKDIILDYYPFCVEKDMDAWSKVFA